MIGKIVTGKSFGGAVRYLLGKEPGKAYILTSGGVELSSRQALIGSYVPAPGPPRCRPGCRTYLAVVPPR